MITREMIHYIVQLQFWQFAVRRNFAKFFGRFIASQLGRCEGFVSFGLIVRNSLFPAKRIHEHAVNKGNGFGFHVCS